MDKREQFYDVIRTAATVTLATAADDRVTMRAVSPVLCQGAILFFTAAASAKYRQLKANPRCCVEAGAFFAEADAEFRGPAMLPENEALRDAYSARFPGAFDEGVSFGGRDAEFILLWPTRLTGWAFADGVPAPDGIPTVPFDIPLK